MANNDWYKKCLIKILFAIAKLYAEKSGDISSIKLLEMEVNKNGE